MCFQTCQRLGRIFQLRTSRVGKGTLAGVHFESMIEGVSSDQEGRDAASIQWFTGERGALPAELLAHRFSLANDYTSMSYGRQVGTNWDNQIANFSAVALRFSGEKCV